MRGGSPVSEESPTLLQAAFLAAYTHEVMNVLNRFLVVKIAAIVLVAVLCGFTGFAWLNAERQFETMERLHEQGARAIAQSLATGVRNSMLRGDGLAVSEFLHDAKKRLALADIKVYAPDGDEVFGDKAPVPAPEALPQHLREVISTHRAAENAGLSAYPIPNEPRCRSCHSEGMMRGVLTLGTEGAAVPIDASTESLQALSSIAHSGFVQIMTAQKDEDIEDYFQELTQRTPGLKGVVVLDSSGEPYFSGGEAHLSPEVAARAVKPGEPFSVAAKDHTTHVVPLENEPRCMGCHEDDDEMRGAIAVAFTPPELAGPETLRHAVTTSLQHVMLAGLGRLIVSFIDDVRDAGLTTTLQVHEANGRLYHDAFLEPEAPVLVAKTLDRGEAQLAVESQGDAFHFVTPMHNEPQCQQCHGTDQPLRGAISVTLDTRAEALAFETRKRESVMLSGITIVMVLFLLYLGLRWTVLRPVKLIGEVADKVAAGHLDVSVELNRVDEMGRLAHQINEMTRGLRQRLELAKFVSDETFSRVSQDDALDRTGTRRRVTVLFSDIRGFTAFSETRLPEEVVEMLNAYLQVQAEIVIRYGGDIDKFVGDELMARFDGETQERRAVQAAVELIEAVDALNRERGADAIAVGVGINSGDAIVGAMGAKTRMDYTVIGDMVNTGARICSAAGRNEVLVSAATKEAAEALEGVVFSAREPIALKGKSQPTQVWEANKAPSEGA